MESTLLTLTTDSPPKSGIAWGPLVDPASRAVVTGVAKAEAAVAVAKVDTIIITTVVFNRSILNPRTGACLKSHLTRALPLSLTLQGITMLTIPAPNTGRLGAEVAMLAEGLAAEPMGVEDARVEDPIEEI